MEGIYMMKECGALITDKGRDGNDLKILEVVVTNGKDTIFAKAFGKTAEELDKAARVGAVYACSFTLMHDKYDKDGKTYQSTRVRLDGMSYLAG